MSSLVKSTRELLAKITPYWRMERAANSDICKILVGEGRWADFKHHLPNNATLIVRAPELLRQLCDEVERVTRDRDELSAEIETCHSLLDQFYAEDPAMTSLDTLEKRLKLHLDEQRPVITDDDVNGDD